MWKPDDVSIDCILLHSLPVSAIAGNFFIFLNIKDYVRTSFSFYYLALVDDDYTYYIYKYIILNNIRWLLYRG